MVLPDNASVLVLAMNYNPSIVSKEWLFKKDIFTEQVKNFVQTPIFSLVENDDFGFVVDEQRLQVIVKKVNNRNLGLACSMAVKFTNALPETPYKSLGINYQYRFPKDNCDLGIVFSINRDKVRSLFSPKYELGTVVIFQFGKFVVNFSVSPSLTEDKTRLNFNFHSDVSNATEIEERLSSRESTLHKAETIVKGLSK